MQAHCEQEHLIDLVAVFSRVVPLPSSVILALPDPAKTAVKPPGAFQVSCVTWRLRSDVLHDRTLLVALPRFATSAGLEAWPHPHCPPWWN